MQKTDVGRLPSELVKVDLYDRIVAKLVDILVFGALALAVQPVGPVAGLLYLLISDGLAEGKSLGKRLIGLRVVSLKTKGPPSLRESTRRNVPIAAVLLLWWIPVAGKALFFTLGVAAVSVELYLLWSAVMGERVGDRWAGTVVVDDRANKLL